ncbi:MAG: hypothetical protein DPW09_38020 [Anaerolineae bacterium]|nr:hypothetical protein [Anaerolineae bacterium]MCQ3979254.1 hypothetical protein [Anaerolineae bacterium]
MNIQTLKAKFDQAVAGFKLAFNKVRINLVAFWANHRRTILRLVALMVIGVVISVLCVYFWRRSSVFRAVVLAMVAGLALGLNNILAWLKNHIPQEQPVRAVGHPIDDFIGEPTTNYTGYNVVGAEDPSLFLAADGRMN